MTLATFLIHFFYIAGTFVAGMAVGYTYKAKLEDRLAKFFKRKD